MKQRLISIDGEIINPIYIKRIGKIKKSNNVECSDGDFDTLYSFNIYLHNFKITVERSISEEFNRIVHKGFDIKEWIEKSNKILREIIEIKENLSKAIEESLENYEIIKI